MVEVTILIPVLNEEASIESTIKEVKRLGLKNAEILVVNDGSTDKTGRILQRIEGIRVLNNPYNMGYGASLKKGLREAKGEWIVITDADATYPIEDIPRLLSFVPEYDMVVGSRTGKHVHIPFFRRPAKWIVGKFANVLAGRKIPDINSGLRVFHREKACEFMNLYPSGFSFTTTITLAFFTSDYSVKYVPINYHRRKGKSTIHPIKDFLGFLTLIFRIIMYFKPMKFFLLPGLVLMLIGTGYGAYQIALFPTGLGQFPILAFLAGMQIVFLGFLGDIIVKGRKN